MRPVPKQFKVNFDFGLKYPPELQYLTVDHLHHGKDFACPKGIPVIFAVDGILNFKGFKRGYGHCVIVKFKTGILWSGKTFRLILAHLEAITTDRKIGQRVGKWESCGLSGDSGMAVGHPHLHVECQELKDGIWVAINPSFVVGSS